MKKMICMVIFTAMLLSITACGTNEADKPKKDSDSPAELKYDIGYYNFEEMDDGQVDVNSLVFKADGTVDFDWATYDYTTVGDYELKYNGKSIYIIAGPTGDTLDYTMSDNKITIVDWNKKRTVLALMSDGTLKVEQTEIKRLIEQEEYKMQ